MYEYVFTFIKPNYVLIFLKILRNFKSLQIIEVEEDKQYKDFYIRIQHNLRIPDYGLKDFFEDWDIEHEPE